jgi:cytochrome oxidase assembly protein ShyY1
MRETINLKGSEEGYQVEPHPPRRPRRRKTVFMGVVIILIILVVLVGRWFVNGLPERSRCEMSITSSSHSPGRI